jgi:hypothetical protein
MKHSLNDRMGYVRKALGHQQLTHRQRNLLSILVTYMPFESGEGWALSKKRLARDFYGRDDLHSQRTIIRILCDLRDAGVIWSEDAYRANNSQSSNVYYVRWVALDEAYAHSDGENGGMANVATGGMANPAIPLVVNLATPLSTKQVPVASTSSTSSTTSTSGTYTRASDDAMRIACEWVDGDWSIQVTNHPHFLQDAFERVFLSEVETSLEAGVSSEELSEALRASLDESWTTTLSSFQDAVQRLRATTNVHVLDEHRRRVDAAKAVLEREEGGQSASAPGRGPGAGLGSQTKASRPSASTQAADPSLKKPRATRAAREAEGVGRAEQSFGMKGPGEGPWSS